jgi:hypothetical protein
MADGKVAKERTTEPIPNVGAIRRIPVIYWREIKSLSELHSIVEQQSVVFENSKMYLKELVPSGPTL